MENQIEYKLTDKFNKDRIKAILAVEKEKGLTPENLLEEAKDKNSPLHDLFEWDDSEAAIQYRLAQARVIINKVEVIINSKEYYAFENVAVQVVKGSSGEVETQRVYKPIVEIMSQEDLRRQVIASALRQHEYWEQQNSKYSELAPIIKSASKVRKSLDKQWKKKQ